MPYQPLLALPTLSLFGLTFAQQVRRLRQAGFHGIELFVFPYQARHLKKYRAIARQYGMRLSLHQTWTNGEGGGFIFNALMNSVGYLPKAGYRLSDIVEGASGELFVVYANYIDRVREITDRVEVALQTASTWSGESAHRTHRMSFDEFAGHISLKRVPIVFDTVHILEWRFGAVGKALAMRSEEELAKELIALWHAITPERIIEIHWNDLDGKTSDGRCMPGEGKLALGLELLAQEIKKYGWGGYIIPEVSPFLLFPYRKRTLIALRERMEKFFA